MINRHQAPRCEDVRSTARCRQRLACAVGLSLLLLVCGCNRESGQRFRDYQPSATADSTEKTSSTQNKLDDERPIDPLLAETPQSISPAASAEVTAAKVGTDVAVPLQPAVAEATTAAGLLEVPLDALRPSVASDAASASPRQIELLIPQQTFVKEKGAWRVSFDDIDLLKVLNMEPVPVDAANHFPEWLRNLNGQRVRIRGYMYPTYQDSGIENFLMVRDTGICCFGRLPKLYDQIFVSLAPGKTTNYLNLRPFDVVGIFRIEMEVAKGVPLTLYWLDEAEVIVR